MIKAEHETTCLVLSCEQHDWLRYRACLERRTMSAIVREMIEAAMGAEQAKANEREIPWGQREVKE